jgi:Tc5 transposase DNA-binding domain
MPKKKVYSQEDLDEAVEKYLEGMKLRTVCKAFPNVPERTITRLAKKKRDGIEAKRPGPPPILLVEIEDDIKAWIVGMQCQGFPVSRDAILIKGNELFHSMFGSTRQVGSLKRGWLNRFMERHPILCLRTAQIVKCVRAEASEELLNFTSTIQIPRPNLNHLLFSHLTT